MEDGFFVKHTADLQGTIAYLVLVTRFLQGMVANTAVVADGAGPVTGGGLFRVCWLGPTIGVGARGAGVGAAELCTGEHLLLRSYEDYAAVTVKTKVSFLRRAGGPK